MLLGFMPGNLEIMPGVFALMPGASGVMPGDYAPLPGTLSVMMTPLEARVAGRGVKSTPTHAPVQLPHQRNPI